MQLFNNQSRVSGARERISGGRRERAKTSSGGMQRCKAALLDNTPDLNYEYPVINRRSSRERIFIFLRNIPWNFSPTLELLGWCKNNGVFYHFKFGADFSGYRYSLLL